MAKNKPKPMRKAVPAGSVYYFRLENEDYTEKIRESFHFKNISDVLPEEGFGLAILGELNYEEDYNNGSTSIFDNYFEYSSDKTFKTILRL